jgi:hypothetical protein
VAGVMMPVRYLFVDPAESAFPAAEGGVDM